MSDKKVIDFDVLKGILKDSKTCEYCARTRPQIPCKEKCPVWNSLPDVSEKEKNIQIVFQSEIPGRYIEKDDYLESRIEYSSVELYNEQIEKELNSGGMVALVRIINTKKDDNIKALNDIDELPF